MYAGLARTLNGPAAAPETWPAQPLFAGGVRGAYGTHAQGYAGLCHLGGGAGCVWLQNCGISAVFFILLHRQVLDLLDYQGGQMKFETRHSPHAFFSY